jgi:tRNA modification GTPase
MRGPRSYTGEDMAELSLHGSPTALDLIVRLLVSLGGRIATRGEFTRRAVLAGKLDLVQAEAILDLIEASGPSGVEEARARLDRSLSAEVRAISDALKDLLADLEAHIDFDEDDEGPVPTSEPALRSVLASMEAMLRRSGNARVKREGIRTVIVGKPNVGKSTLFNALLRADRAIVTPHRGTTRDALEDSIVVEGIVFRLWDTAGMRERAEPIEEEGIRRARVAMDEADLVLVVLDASTALDEEDRHVLEATANTRRIMVFNKMDLCSRGRGNSPPAGTEPRVQMSAKTGSGLEALEQTIAEEGRSLTAAPEQQIRAGLSSRGALLMEAAMGPVRDLVDRFDREEAIRPEILTLELRRALTPLEEITGERVDEGVLDRIFERFCVGK